MAVETDQKFSDASAATMMLYAAGELEPAARAAFEQRMAAEPQLAADVQQLAAALDANAADLARADASARVPVNEGVAVRRVSRAIDGWLLARTAAPPAPVKKGLPLPWWAYPTAAAASLIVGFLVWSSRQEVPPFEASPDVKHGLSMLEQEQAELADWLVISLDETADASMDADMARLLSAGGADDLNSTYLLPPPGSEENTQ